MHYLLSNPEKVVLYFVEEFMIFSLLGVKWEALNQETARNICRAEYGLHALSNQYYNFHICPSLPSKVCVCVCPSVE